MPTPHHSFLHTICSSCHPTNSVLRPFVWDYPGVPVPESWRIVVENEWSPCSVLVNITGIWPVQYLASCAQRFSSGSGGGSVPLGNPSGPGKWPLCENSSSDSRGCNSNTFLRWVSWHSSGVKWLISCSICEETSNECIALRCAGLLEVYLVARRIIAEMKIVCEY